MEQESRSFELLDERIQRYIYQAGWSQLRDIQEKAIPLILSGDQDVIIAAATAQGKTEAAFLPALTYALKVNAPALIVYVGPLKALINDQFKRLQDLCEQLHIPVHPWHGDISATLKSKFLKEPVGVLLITPESLEATLCNRGSAVKQIFQHTSYFILDELHAFMGNERGQQLRSLLHRIEMVTSKRVPRIGLSATLGDMSAAAKFMRPDEPGKVAMAISTGTGSGLRVIIKGYEEPSVVPTKETEKPVESAPGEIVEHLYKVLRGSNNLVFPNTRRAVEDYSYQLSRLCEKNQVPNEFWPHHGNLSKEIRTEVESALKHGETPITAICTNTLELGIDIGAVQSVVQIGCPPSVASLRQRLGRSGRRKDEPAILRCYQVEDELSSKSSISTELRVHLVQTAAMITLLAEKWFEPPPAHALHLSTFVQQLLSMIAQNGGITAAEAYRIFCNPGAPFYGIQKPDFIELLQHLGQKKLIVQDGAGLLLHGEIGERIVNHYSFYAAFSTDEEYKIVAGPRTLGSLPITSLVIPGQFMLFAGRTWRVDDVDDEKKTIHVSYASGGRAPAFSGGGNRVHTMIRQRMRALYEGKEGLPFLDLSASKFLEQGRATYIRLELAERWWMERGSDIVVWTWLGDNANDALAAIFRSGTLEAFNSGPYITIQKGKLSTAEILTHIQQFAASPVPDLDTLLADAKALRKEKWDWALSEHLLRMSYSSQNLNMEEALGWVRQARPYT